MDVEREIQIVNAITFLVEEQSTEPVSSTIEATDEPCPAPIEGLDPDEEPVVPEQSTDESEETSESMESSETSEGMESSQTSETMESSEASETMMASETSEGMESS